MKVLSLFDGISCGMVALERAGIPVERYVAYEIDKYAIQISKKNYPNIEHCGNVLDGDFAQYKDFDLLIGGSPCQDLSIANSKGKGLAGQRSGLFWQYLRALEQAKPKHFLFENVASMKKADRQTITDMLKVEPIMINLALVSAQSRKRLYWTNIPNIQQPADKGILLKSILESGIAWQNKSYCMTATYPGAIFKNTLSRHQRTMIAEPVRVGQIGKGGQGQRIYSVYGNSVTLSENGGGQGANTGLYKINLPNGDYIVRKLTPVEAERLQTLPDNYTLCDGVSNRQRYKCIGNGWTVDVIAHILSNIKQEAGNE